MPHDVLIVGAGPTSAACACTLAEAGKSVLVLERRGHLAGNAFDCRDAHGLTIHQYGPHLFHTGKQDVVDFLSRFTAWHPYEHRVLARLDDGRLLPLPINRTTLEGFFGVSLPTEADAAALLEREKVHFVAPPNTSEEVVLGAVGPKLFSAFFAGYTQKQWGCPARELGPEVCARIPVRLSRDDRYFTDPFQALPKDGYTALFTRMFDHPNIRVECNEAYCAQKHRHLAKTLVWTGCLDACFDSCYGPLAWRAIRFEHFHIPGQSRVLPVCTVNEPSPSVSYTRTTEFTHCTGESHSGSSLCREYSGDAVQGGEPAYPLPTQAMKTLADRYRALAPVTPNLLLAGRLGGYRYLNLDQAVAEGIAAAHTILGTKGFET